MTPTKELRPMQSVRDWYYEEISKLPLKRGDCEDIWWTIANPISCHYVQCPDGWTREEAESHLNVLKRELNKKGYL